MAESSYGRLRYTERLWERSAICGIALGWRSLVQLLTERCAGFDVGVTNISLAGEAFSGALTSDNLHLIPTVAHSMRLIDSCLQLMAMRNLICIGALLHMEIDACIRLYALFIAENPEALIRE